VIALSLAAQTWSPSNEAARSVKREGPAAPRLDSEHFRFVPRTCPSVRWQAKRAGSHACYLSSFATPKDITMSEQAVEERRGWASDIVWVVLYSILVLLVMLLWVSVPA
jgi:hypothetical protein